MQTAFILGCTTNWHLLKQYELFNVLAALIMHTQPGLDTSEKLFTEAVSPYYGRPLGKLRNRGSEAGIELRAIGECRPQDVDVLISVDLPKTRRDLLELFSRYPQARKVLIVMESPIRYPELLSLQAHAYFDHVLTYDRAMRGARYAHYRLPVADLQDLASGLNWEDRRLLLTIATNYKLGFAGWRRWNVTSLLRGWTVKPVWANRANHDGYIARRAFAAAVDRKGLDDHVHIYGAGWQGEPQTRLQALGIGRAPRFRCAQGRLTDAWAHPKTCQRYRFFLALENFVGSVDYVSEKLFHAIHNGCVPVYLGDSHIVQRFPRGSIVDVRQYDSWEAVLDALAEMTETEWTDRREACRQFFFDDLKEEFGDKQFSDAVMSVMGAIH